MVQPKYSPQEALERVKLMMKYDTSKTLNENKEIILEQSNSRIGSSYTAPVAGAAGTAAARAAGSGLAGLGSSALSLTTVALPWIAGAAVVGGLGYWLYDSINNGKPTAEKVKSFLDSCSTQAKNLKQVASDSEIVSAAEKINSSIEGLGTNENDIKSAIESMGNVADLCALKTKYDARYGSLYEDLDGDIDGTDWKTYIWAPMQTIIEKSAEKLEEVKPTISGGTGNTGRKTGGYKDCTSKGIYSFGCKTDPSGSIGQVQSCLGLVVDGKYGKNTNTKLKEIGYTSFKDADIQTICNKQKQPDTSKEAPKEVPKDDIVQVDSEDAVDLLK